MLEKIKSRDIFFFSFGMMIAVICPREWLSVWIPISIMIVLFFWECHKAHKESKEMDKIVTEVRDRVLFEAGQRIYG